MMKKTLVALALAATTVSGSAMAWTADGTGGTLVLGGTLTPAEIMTPWEVLVGPAVADLNAPIKRGASSVDIPVNKAITVLGIRTLTNQPFNGGVGLAPQIDFKGAYATATQTNSTGALSMDVLDTKDAVIGHLTVPMVAGGLNSYHDPDTSAPLQATMYADTASQGFFGGLSSQAKDVDVDVASKLNLINPEFSANYNTQGGTMSKYPMAEYFQSTTNKFSSYYGSGIMAGQVMKLTLNTPAASDAISWKANLPITVSYQ
ncbi:hypothetical protein APF40_21455 [Salmonella enterica subsp. enterica serovar Newport]|nr:hypothetical protein [Salmonella enterica subsp. enterica serovar Newport]